eukprot:TRINITY_DN3882_c0_g1_i2.p1 TRINITY_DN3882_c0_g1~~TRINITY_DN3882_c0_g1_i2.p1  ORF type:complete len:811 (-),score=137.13 TRINITY_DN3882_c0_g1_i2:1198-3630(-)
MTTQDPIQFVNAAIITLNYNNDPQSKREADSFLQKFQSTPGAWSVSHHLLLHSNDIAVQFVTANILYHKTKYDWRGLDLETRRGLLLSFFELVKKKSGQPSLSVVFNRICLTLSAAIARSTSDLLSQVLESLFSDAQNDEGKLVLLEVLSNLVEEVNSAVMTLKELTENKRAMQNFMERIVLLVKQIVTESERGQNANTRSLVEKSLIVLCHWVKFGIPLSFVSEGSQGKSLLEYVFDFVNPNGPYIPSIEILLQLFAKPARFEKASALLNKPSFDQGGSGDSFFLYVVDRVLRLRPMWQGMKDDDQFTKGLVRLGIGVGEGNLTALLHSNNNWDVKLKYLAFLVELTASANDKGTEMCINFWSCAEESVRSCDVSQKQTLFPVFNELIQVLLRRIEWKDEFEDEEEEESLYSLRTHSRGFFSGMTQFFGIELYIQSLFTQLQSCPGIEHWKQAEAIIMVTGCLSATANVDELTKPGVNEVIQKIIEIIFKFPNHPKFHSAAALFIGNLGGWFNKNPNELGKAITYLVQLFHSSDVESRSTSVESFKNLCEMCGELMSSNLETLIQAAESAFPLFGINDRAALMEGLVNVVVYLNPSQVTSAMYRIIGPVLARIDQLVKVGTREASQSVKPELSLLSKAFELPDNDQEIQTVDIPLEMILPILNSLLAVWHSETEVMKLLCDLFKIAINGVDRKQFIGNNHLIDLLNNIAKLYSSYHQDFCIDLIQNAIDTGVKIQKETELVMIFEAVSSTTFSILSSNRSHVSLIGSFFSLCNSMIKKNPICLRSPSISIAVQLSIACFGINGKQSFYL